MVSAAAAKLGALAIAARGSDHGTRIVISECHDLVYKVGIRLGAFDLLPEDEVMYIGAYGLTKAVRDFDETRGVLFFTVAYRYVWHEIFSEVRRVRKIRSRIPVDKAVSVEELICNYNEIDVEYKDLVEGLVKYLESDRGQLEMLRGIAIHSSKVNPPPSLVNRVLSLMLDGNNFKQIAAIVGYSREYIRVIGHGIESAVEKFLKEQNE